VHAERRRRDLSGRTARPVCNWFEPPAQGVPDAKPWPCASVAPRPRVGRAAMHSTPTAPSRSRL